MMAQEQARKLRRTGSPGGLLEGSDQEEIEALETLKYKIIQLVCYKLRARREEPRVTGEDYSQNGGLQGSPL